MLTVIVTIAIFMLLISVHEFGHFVMAKLMDIKVEEFSIGMGPGIFKKQGQETLYSLRLVPIGGYCRFAEEDGKNPDALSKQKRYKRFLVLISGALLNIVLGYLIFVLMTAVMPKADGELNTISVPVVDSVVENSYASQAGLMSGDKIIKINGHKINFYQDVTLYTSDFDENTDCELTVKRGNEEINISFKPSVSETTYNYEEDFVEVETSINGNVTSQKYDYSVVASEEEIAELKGTSETQKRLIIGFVPQQEVVGFSNMFTHSFYYTVFVVKLVFKSLGDILTGTVGFDAVSGPVAIAGEVNNAVNTGVFSFVNVLYLAAIITINLGIFNLLPVPALDGGRLVFLIIEAIRRKPISVQKEEAIHTIGLVVLLILGVVIAFSDVFKLIR